MVVQVLSLMTCRSSIISTFRAIPSHLPFSSYPMKYTSSFLAVAVFVSSMMPMQAVAAVNPAEIAQQSGPQAQSPLDGDPGQPDGTPAVVVPEAPSIPERGIIAGKVGGGWCTDWVKSRSQVYRRALTGYNARSYVKAARQSPELAIVKTPVEGAIVLLRTSDSRGHVGIVERVDGDNLTISAQNDTGGFGVVVTRSGTAKVLGVLPVGYIVATQGADGGQNN